MTRTSTHHLQHYRKLHPFLRPATSPPPIPPQDIGFPLSPSHNITYLDKCLPFLPSNTLHPVRIVLLYSWNTPVRSTKLRNIGRKEILGRGFHEFEVTGEKDDTRTFLVSERYEKLPRVQCEGNAEGELVFLFFEGERNRESRYCDLSML